MTGCSAFNCSNRSEQGYVMKVFPTDPKRKALWASKVKRLNWKPTSSSYLCEMHFADDQWLTKTANGKKKLKPDAVPTLFSHTPMPQKRKSTYSRSEQPLKKILLDEEIVHTLPLQDNQNIMNAAPSHDHSSLIRQHSFVNIKPVERSPLSSSPNLL